LDESVDTLNESCLWDQAIVVAETTYCRTLIL
jgi:hypothetical protein